MYFMGLVGNLIMPRAIPKKFLNDESSKYTIGFSNTPGPIKPFFYLHDG